VLPVALQGLPGVPAKYQDRMELSEGYTSDAIKSALMTRNGKIDPQKRALMIDNVAAYLAQHPDAAGKNINPRNKAVQFVNYFTNKDLGGMQRLDGGK